MRRPHPPGVNAIHDSPGISIDYVSGTPCQGPLEAVRQGMRGVDGSGEEIGTAEP